MESMHFIIIRGTGTASAVDVFFDRFRDFQNVTSFPFNSHP